MQVALIGYGEVGRILAEDLRARGTAVVAFDILAAAASPASEAMRRHASQHGVALADSHVSAARQGGLVISAVTASQAARGGAVVCDPAWRAARFSSTSIRRRRVPRSAHPTA